MAKLIPVLYLLLAFSFLGKRPKNTSESSSFLDTIIHFKDEIHFKTLRQLTFGGSNAEAYWSFDDSKLTFQATNPEWQAPCDQIFYFSWQTADLRNQIPAMVSTGKGRTTCSYFLPGDSLVLYASTHLTDDACPPEPAPRSDGKYVWPIYTGFDIFVARTDGQLVTRLTNTPGYDAEATLSPKGDKIVFTSIRSGDLELYTMNTDGSDVKQVTNELGYDGGAFFSPDGTKLVFRASRPKTAEDIKEYKDLLKQGLVTPVRMEIFTCNVDGSELQQVTHLGGANWCPFYHPSGKKIIFSSNFQSPNGFPFNLYMINTDGSDLEKITHDGSFNAFPVFSNNGKYLVFSSSRNASASREINLFVAEWKD